MEIAYPDFMDNKGVLYVIFNTSKGKNLSSKLILFVDYKFRFSNYKKI